jgi:thiamine biosynthesis protein ThiS
MKPDMVRVTANGDQVEVPATSTVAGFLSSRGLKPTQVVVELNGRVLAREKLDATHLQHCDELEVIVPVAGG